MKMLRKVLLTLFGIACFLAAAFVLLMAYASFTSPEIGAGFGAFLLAIAAVIFFVGFFVFKKAIVNKQNHDMNSVDYANYGKSFAAGFHVGLHEADSDPVKEESATAPAPAEEEPSAVPEPVDEAPEAVDEAVDEAQAAADPVVSVPDDSKMTTFLVAGIYYREDAVIDNLLYENPDFEMTKEEIIECCMEDADIYKYEPFYGYAELVPEPDNPHDPNAIKVIVDGVHIGYVPAKRTKSIKKILDSNNVIAIGCEIFGGPYKILSDENADIERGKSDIKCRVCIDYK